MATRDEDPHASLPGTGAGTGAIPEPDAEPSPGELAHARRFAELVDKALAGRTPPAMSADDRALLEVATVIRATRGNAELAADRQAAVVEDALRLAIGAPAGGATPLPLALPLRTGSSAPVRRPRWPWVVTGASTLVAAAAIAVLWLRPPRPVARVALPVEWTSRSADALVGPITREHAGDAGARIDEIFADRLDGFRAHKLARGDRP